MRFCIASMSRRQVHAWWECPRPNQNTPSTVKCIMLARSKDGIPKCGPYEFLDSCNTLTSAKSGLLGCCRSGHINSPSGQRTLVRQLSFRCYHNSSPIVAITLYLFCMQTALLVGLTGCMPCPAQWCACLMQGCVHALDDGIYQQHDDNFLKYALVKLHLFRW